MQNSGQKNLMAMFLSKLIYSWLQLLEMKETGLGHKKVSFFFFFLIIWPTFFFLPSTLEFFLAFDLKKKEKKKL